MLEGNIIPISNSAGKPKLEQDTKNKIQIHVKIKESTFRFRFKVKIEKITSAMTATTP